MMACPGVVTGIFFFAFPQSSGVCFQCRLLIVSGLLLSCYLFALDYLQIAKDLIQPLRFLQIQILILLIALQTAPKDDDDSRGYSG